MHGFWLVEEVADLVGRPTACHEAVRGGRLFAWNFAVARSTVVMEVERRTRPNITLSLHKWLAPSLLCENSTIQKPCTVPYLSIC